MPVINTNSVDPDQMLHSAESDLGLHCLPMSHLWDTRHKWVKIFTPYICIYYVSVKLSALNVTRNLFLFFLF